VKKRQREGDGYIRKRVRNGRIKNKESVNERDRKI
jgi:hypothetical protein